MGNTIGKLIETLPEIKAQLLNDGWTLEGEEELLTDEPAPEGKRCSDICHRPGLILVQQSVYQIHCVDKANKVHHLASPISKTKFQNLTKLRPIRYSRRLVFLIDL